MASRKSGANATLWRSVARIESLVLRRAENLPQGSEGSSVPIVFAFHCCFPARGYWKLVPRPALPAAASASLFFFIPSNQAFCVSVEL